MPPMMKRFSSSSRKDDITVAVSQHPSLFVKIPSKESLVSGFVAA